VDVGEPDEEEEELEDVLPDAALVVDAVVLAPELDAVVLADVDGLVVVPLVPSPVTAAGVVDCICMVLEFNVQLRDAIARGQSA
jgi:hypothetical protein